MSKLSGAALGCALFVGITSAWAGGIQPLTCSQGDEIRTIDYHMDLNMDRLQEIHAAEMDAQAREEAIEENTEEFVDLQARREKLSQECALQIRKRNQYYQQ